MTPDKFFSTEEKNRISAAIAEAELNTSGEIRVHIESELKGDVLDRAAYVFKSLEMQKTELRNAVLFYLAVNSKKFAILGDAGINVKVPAGFWDDIKSTMQEQFIKNEFTEGLCRGIIMAGKELKHHFPYSSDDINELSDEVSFGKK